ncbi:MAG: SulP family inorganic anion transporter [Longimicrobiales bacterium]
MMSGDAAAPRRGMWGPARPAPRDIIAGLSVALVLIPQSFAYAELAGLTGTQGLYASAVPLIAAAFFASCPYLQTGPVALTALLTYGALVPLAETGSADYIGAAALLALIVGVTRMGIGFIKAGWVSYIMSEPVLRGFTSGAAVLIILSQIPGALGVQVAATGPVSGFFEVLTAPSAWNPTAAAMTLMTLAATLLARRIHRLLPGALIAVVVGIVVAGQVGYQGPTVGPVEAAFPPLSLDVPWGMFPALLLPGVVIALVGFAESAAICQMYASRERARWDPDQEFLSQGAANLAAGVLGGFPVGGSFSRSSLNQMSGAVTRWSGAATGLAILMFLPFTDLLAPLPKAVLAGVVIAAVVGLLRLPSLLGLWKLSYGQAMVAWATFAFCLLLSPRIEQAVLMGILMSFMAHAWRERKAAFVAEMDGRTLRIQTRGVLWFASAPRLEQRILSYLAETEDIDTVVINLGGLGRIDLTGALVIGRILDEIGAAGIDGSLEAVPRHAERVLANVLGDQSQDSPSDELTAGDS